jgi:hypothetical protein
MGVRDGHESSGTNDARNESILAGSNDLVGYEERRNIESFKQDLCCSLSARKINIIRKK